MYTQCMDLPTTKCPSDARPSEWSRFKSFIEVDENNCWVWQGSRKSPPGQPYGFFGLRGKSRLAHRVAYEWFEGDLDPNLEVDHLCENPPCVNPSHLEQTTRKENLRRSGGITAENSRKTHCPQGHPLSGNNLFINNQKRRVCRECSNRRSREWKKRTGYKP